MRETRYVCMPDEPLAIPDCWLQPMKQQPGYKTQCAAKRRDCISFYLTNGGLRWIGEGVHISCGNCAVQNKTLLQLLLPLLIFTVLHTNAQCRIRSIAILHKGSLLKIWNRKKLERNITMKNKAIFGKYSIIVIILDELNGQLESLCYRTNANLNETESIKSR